MYQKNLAELLARRAHEGQFRRDGITPYIKHPEGVAERLKGESDEVVAVAWLHDVLEDTKMTEAILLQEGLSIAVVQAVSVLTKQKGQLYWAYLAELNKNPIAKKVKIADMLHNLSDSPTEKQIIKYCKGLIYLLGGPNYL